jgi:hypothetical protein
MTALAKPDSLVGALPPVDELSAQAMLDALGGQKEKPLIFNYDGRDVRPSYHVTEVKTGAFRGLDCGANTESWNETFIQLWDIEEDHRGHMPAGKFLAIIGKVAQAVGFDADARLTFEVSDGVKPMQLYRAERIEAGEAVRIVLSPRPSSCKPRDRWLAQEYKDEQEQAACCGGGKAEAKACCG